MVVGLPGYCKGNKSWGNPFPISMIMGGSRNFLKAVCPWIWANYGDQFPLVGKTPNGRWVREVSPKCPSFMFRNYSNLPRWMDKTVYWNTWIPWNHYRLKKHISLFSTLLFSKSTYICFKIVLSTYIKFLACKPISLACSSVNCSLESEPQIQLFCVVWGWLDHTPPNFDAILPQ